MGNVRRVYVEKKPDFAVKAKELKHEVKHYLGIAADQVRVLIRYDVENVSDATYQKALQTVFSEPPVDDIYEENFDAEGGNVFSVEFLPGQFDQRADSAEQCVKLLNENEEPLIRTAVTYVIEGEISDAEFEAIKKHCINPVDSRETGLEKPQTLVQSFPEPEDVKIFDGFSAMPEAELKELYDSLGLAMTFKDFLHIQNYFKNEEKRDPSMTEIRVLDTYWSDHCRHTTFSTELKDVTITDGKIVGDYAKYAFTIAPMTGGWSVQSASGKYISGKSGSNKIITGSTPELNTITFADGNVKIASNNTTLQYNAAATNGTRFRYYKSENQQPVALYKLSTVPARQSGIVTDLTTLQNGDKVVVFNPANKKALSSVYNGFYNTGVDVELTGGKLTGYTNAELWTVNRTESGAYTFSTADGKKLSMDEKYSSTPLDKTHTGWSILPAATENCVYIQNVGRSSYLEWYAEKNNWSAFGTIGSNEALFAQQLYLVGDEMDQPAGSLPQEGAQVVLFNQNAQGVLAQQNDNTDSPAINSVSARITDGKAIPENGGVVFTVERSGEYYRFRNETYGYLCSNGTGNNAFYSQTASEDADWTVEPCSGGVGGYQLESRTAKFNGRYSQYLEYYSDSYKTYSMYNVTDYTIYSFFFYGVADSVKLDGGVVNDPAVVFTSADTVKAGQDYTLTFTVNDVKAVSKLEILVDGKTAGVITDYTADGKNYTANVSAAMLAGADKVTLTVRVTNASGASYSGSLVLTVVDEPSIGAVTPLKGSQTGSDKRPVISAEIINAGENPTLEMTVNGQRVNAVYAGGKLTYTPAAGMTDGRTNVSVTVTRADGKTASFNWFFTVGQAQYQLYFGQLHSHTQYSDGAGSLDAALDYVKNLPESANVQFVAFTDHSNYFDTTGAANPEGALYDMSLASASSQETWNSYRSSVAAFNEANAGSLVALAGFEMTWSGGPGHINTFN